MPLLSGRMSLSERVGASLGERARWFAKQYQVRKLSDELGLPETYQRDLETLQTVATIKAHLRGPVRTIVDVGAHVGRFAEPAMVALSADEVVCVEPYQRLHGQLRSRLASLKHRILDCALDDAPAEAELRIHQDLSMNSLLDADYEILTSEFATYDHRRIETFPVRVSTLDVELDRLRLKEPFFIKLDTQGTELRILRGATRALQKTSAVLVEHMFTTPYRGVPGFGELVAFMECAGFACSAVTAVTRRATHRVSAVDFLFCRDEGP